MHYNCGIYDVVCQIISRIHIGLVAYSAQRNVFRPVLEKVFATRRSTSGVSVTPYAPTDFNIFVFFRSDHNLGLLLLVERQINDLDCIEMLYARW